VPVKSVPASSRSAAKKFPTVKSQPEISRTTGTSKNLSLPCRTRVPDRAGIIISTQIKNSVYNVVLDDPDKKRCFKHPAPPRYQ